MPHHMPIRPVIGEDASPTSFYPSPQSHGQEADQGC
uniref:Uncharacterized protein n=1 Tax=Rhizophora mucronata TaxID=61149 RepID=A0A2P2NUK0_RHIMU